MKRTIALILAAITSVSLLASCKNGDVTDTETTVPVDSETEPYQPDDPGFTVAGNPIEEYDIVIPEEAEKVVLSGASDMAELILKATDHKPQIRTEKSGHSIILDVTAYDTDEVKAARAEVGADGYAMLEQNGDLYITGAIPLGTRNGVYDFLQNHLGLRFYCGSFTAVRKDGIHNIEAGHRTVYTPVFLYRNNYCTEVMMNVNNYAARTMGSGTMSGGIGGPHNLGPRSGKGDVYGRQPCLSDPEVYDAVLQSVFKDIDNRTGDLIINVCQNDGAGFCRCDKCTEKYEAAGRTDMGPLLLFINDIADAVKEKYPDRDINILTLAYQDSTVCPDPEYVKPRDNVIIQLCMMNSTCFAHAFNDPECEINRVTYDNIRKWSDVCRKLYVWDYCYNHASYEASVGPDLDVLWDNMQMFRDCHFIGQFQQSSGVETGEFVELRSYLIGRLMWNPNITREEYVTMYDEFMEDYYGDAAPYIKEYIDLLNESSRRPGLTDWNGHTSVYTDMSVFFVPRVDKKQDTTVIDRCRELWDKALSCTLDDVTFAHVEKSSITFMNALSLYAGERSVKKKASNTYKALCDKYTYDWDGKLPDAGPTEGFSTTVPSEGLEFRTYENGECYVSDAGDFRAGMLVIPTSHEGAAVTSVGQSAFSRCDYIVELHVPEGIRYIGKFAFRNCVNMQSVCLPESLETLEYAALGITGNAYYENTAMKDIYYAGTSERWEALFNAYNGASVLKNVTVHCSDKDVEL